MFAYFLVPKLSPASATIFWQQQLATTELNSPLTDCSCWLVLVITPQHGPHSKCLFHYCCVISLPWKHACLHCQNTVVLHIVPCRPVTVQWPRDKQLYKSCYWVTASQTHMFPRQQLNYNSEEWCFLCSPCRDVISVTRWELQLVELESIRRIRGWCEMAASLEVSCEIFISW
jgi:hypothetical protein